MLVYRLSLLSVFLSLSRALAALPHLYLGHYHACLSVFLSVSVPHHVLVHLHHNLHRDQDLARAHALYYASPWVCLYLELVHPARQQSLDDVSLLPRSFLSARRIDSMASTSFHFAYAR